MPRARHLPTVTRGESALRSISTRDLFEDNPASRRRLVLLLYGAVTPGFLVSLLFLGPSLRSDPLPLAAVAALILAGALWVYLRRSPATWDWIFPVAVGPTSCVGIAYASSGGAGDAYLALLGAPLVCAAALFPAPVALAALAAVAATLVASLPMQMSTGATVVSTLLLVPAAAVAGWVVFSSANHFRVARLDLQRLGQRDRALLRSLPDVLVRVDRGGRILDAHVPPREGGPEARDALVGRPIQDLVPGLEPGALRGAVARALGSHEPQRLEYSDPGPGGNRSYEATLVRSGPEEVTFIRRDVTDRRRADDDRRFSETLLSRMQEAVIAVDVELNVVKWSGGAERVYGFTEAEAMGKPIAALVQPDLAGPQAAAFASSLAWRGTDHAVIRQRRKDGRVIVIDSNVAVLNDASGGVTGYLAVCRDVTAQKQAERALRESAARLRATFESPAVGIALSTPDKRWIEVNDQLCAMLGYSRDELSGMTWLDVTYPDDVSGNVALFDNLLAGQRESYSLDKRFVRKDGTTFWCLVSASSVRGADRAVRYVVSIYIDIEKRRQAEDALRESERWLRMSQEIARIGHYVYDVAADRWESSPALDGIFGIDASFPRGAADWVWIVHPEDRGEMREYLGELLATGSRFDREYRIVNQATGATCWVQGLGELTRGPDGAPVRLVGTIQDVTARKAAEVERTALQAKLALSARLAAMGTLVAGVAHEINNPLAAELSSQDLALDAARELRERLEAAPGVDTEVGLLDQVIENLADAQEGGRRIARIVKDFAAFGRPNPPRSRARLVDVVQQALTWLPGWVSHAATVRVESAAAPDVLVASSQVEQVVINLVSNAAKAMPAGRKGTILLRVGASGGTVNLDVVDDGSGIAPEHLDRIFEPFFTTRAAGDQRGIGIGLSISHSIVEAHGGTLTVTSEPGKGSTFRVALPSAPTDG